MQHACFLRLGHLPRQIPTRHHHLRQFLLPQITFRKRHGLSKEGTGSLEGIHKDEGLHRTRPSTTDAQLRGRRSPSRLHRATQNQSQSQSPRHTSRSAPEQKPVNKKGLSRLIKTNSTFTQRDMRVKFVKDFDELEDESRKLAKVLHRFAQTEKHQRDRLRIIAADKDRKNTMSRFAAWKSALKDFLPEPTHPKPMSLVEARHVKWIQNCTTVDEMVGNWPRVPPKLRKSQKDSSLALISAAVRHVPDKVHLIFEAALSSPHGQPYWYIVEDVLELLATRLRVIGLAEVKALEAQKLARMATRILITRARGSIQFSQVTIRSILVALPADAVEPWYSQLLDAECDLHPFTEVQFASRLAKSAPTKALSAEVLMRLQKANLLDINTPVAASVVTTILSFNQKDLAKLDDHSTTPADLFRDLHNAGLIPNVITYTAIIRGLCLKQDLRAALDVLEVMKQHGVQPNEWTYAILLQGCKMRGDWTALADIAVQACHANTREKVVWNEVLHAIYICCLRQPDDRKPRRALLYALTLFYSRVFDAVPVRPFMTGRLAEMGEHIGQQQWFPEPLRRLITDVPPLPPSELRSPGPDTLSILLLGLIRTLPLPYDVVVFYSQFRQMLREGHPVAELMVQERGSFVHDIVLRNLLKWPGTLRVALDIIRDMMRDIGRKSESTTGTSAPRLDATILSQQLKPSSDEDAPPSQQSSSEPRRPPIPHPAPSIYTWTVLVHGFMKAKQPQDAEHIMTLMRNNGIEPNLVTWNTLAAGYAKLQMIPEAVNTMRRLEAEGHEADDWTMRAFSYIGNKAKAIELMEATVEANKARKIAADQGEALSRGEWAADAVDIVGQVTQETPADRWPQLGDEAREQEEEDFLDRELEARLDMNMDTFLDADIDKDINKLELEGLSVDVSNRMAQPSSSHKGVVRKLAESAPVEGSRHDTDGWQEIKRLGLDALLTAPVRPTKQPDESSQAGRD